MVPVSARTTAIRIAESFNGWENFWLFMLVLLFIIYPLLMSLVLFIVGKITGLHSLLNASTILQSFGIALLGLVVAFGFFIIIFVTALLFLNIDPLYYYLAFWLFIGGLSYRLIKDAMLAERRNKDVANR